MVGRVMPCIGADGEFASDITSRAAAVEWLGMLVAEGKRWSEARGEIAGYYRMSGMDNQSAHAKSKAAKDFLKPWLKPPTPRGFQISGTEQSLPM